jgi:hypothetical protein
MQFEILMVDVYPDGSSSEAYYSPFDKFRTLDLKEAKYIGDYLKEGWEPFNIFLVYSGSKPGNFTWSFKRRIDNNNV